LMGLLSIVFAPGASGADSDQKSQSVTIKAVDEPLTQVLERISDASGYKIVVDEKWGKVRVSLSFENESLDNALNRVLANLNHAVVWNEQERKISIFISGKTDSGKSKSSYSSEATREGYPSVETEYDRDSSVSNEKPPSYAPYDRSQRIKRLPESGPSQQEPAVSVTGEKTRFGQNSSTID
jgi:type II secretory pathway component GspD/PulD (secretin)